ncbi:hypothetical protein OAA91_01925 [Fibrobacterales bacterium]|nr:hypothetical protein [Fibrobacterales bacterium]
MRKITITLTSILILSNLFWLTNYAYTSIDHGVTISYQNASIETSSKMLEQALIIANQKVVGKSLSLVQSSLTLDVYGLEPFIKDGCLNAGGLCLKIGENNHISEVQGN